MNSILDENNDFNAKIELYLNKNSFLTHVGVALTSLQDPRLP